MRIASIRKMDISNGSGIGIALFTQGCPIRCMNCFNQETWDFDGGKEWNKTYENKVVELSKQPHIVRMSILGGEPLIDRNIQPLTKLIRRVKAENSSKEEFKIWLYTGQLYEDVSIKYPDIIALVDILVDGPFVDSLKDFRLSWRGSSNQRVIDMNETRANGKVSTIDDKLPYSSIIESIGLW